MLLKSWVKIFTIVIVGILSAGAIVPGAAAAAVPPPAVSIAVDRQSATVGDPITLTLQVRYDTSLMIAVAFPGQTMGPFDVISDSVIADARDLSNTGLYERRWRLAVFQTGEFWIPSLRGGVADTAGEVLGWMTDSVLITIESVLTDADDSADIKGLKAPYEANVALSAWWYLVAGLLIAGVVGLIYWKRRRHPLLVAAPPVVPPWESALDELRAMHGVIDPESDGGRLWYFRLSEILRRYLDGRYGWQSIDQTTTEILRELKKAPFHDPHRERVREFLKLADMVRYARAHAHLGRPENDWQWVEGFVEDTRPHRIAPVTDAADAVAKGTMTATAAAGESTASDEPSSEERR